MLTQIADGVWTHQSTFMHSNAVVVRGNAGVLLVDPGITADELTHIAADLSSAGESVAAGFSTHPHWDHLLWHPEFGDVPRHATAVCAAAIGARLADPDWKDFVAGMIPADIVDDVSLDDVFGRITGLPAQTAQIPWDGPAVQILEHSAHAPGHAALLIVDSGVLIAGDMLSDVLVPILNAMSPTPVDDYLASLTRIEQFASGADVVVPGHGSVGDAAELQRRIDEDRAYLLAISNGTSFSDSRIGSSARPGWEWVTGLHESQLQRLAAR